jgi:subtilisin-like proprotein convertase family protein/uncharacterized protein YvpB
MAFPNNKSTLILVICLSLTGLFLVVSSQRGNANEEVGNSTATLSPTVTLSSTPTPSPTATPSLTAISTQQTDPTPTLFQITETPEPTEQNEQPAPPAIYTNIHIPLIFRQQLATPFPSVEFRLCNYSNAPIPDNDPVGIDSQIAITDPRYIQDLDIQLDIEHGNIGDLSVSLTHTDTGKSTSLIYRPIDPGTGKRCKLSDVKGILDDEISASVQNQCASSPAAISGIYVPNQPLEVFTKENITGTWTLNVSDNNLDNTGRLKSWCMVGRIGEVLQPTPTPQPPQLPPQAYVSGVTGQNQAMPLDCEARVAVDYAKFFGVNIGEYNFFNHLPKSDNPDAGFVGDVYGTWGQIPPNPYGVHAEPVAALLRAFGVTAYAHRPLSWDDLRTEVSSGKPVFVWVIGPASYNEIPVYYTSAEGHMTIVAHYEHVVMVKGYTETDVTIQDGSNTYTRSIRQFLSTWSALENMAITTQP